jgi:Immunity protein Imm1
MAPNSRKLIVTRMDGPDDSSSAGRELPSWADIEQTIRRLDGKTCTLLILGIGPAPVPHMAIGGGEDGKYIVYSTSDNRIFQNLLDPKAPAGKCSLVAGGQRGDYDLRICVGLPAALRAARTYAETGENDATLSWEIQR